MLASWLDTVLDRTVVGGYSRAGYALRSRAWEPLPRMDGKVVLVTGASSGLGRAAAERFAALGATVRDVVRDLARARPGGSPLVCDVSSLADVRRFVAELPDARVDVLVNNAGALPPARAVTPEGFEVAFATNVLGPFLLTRLLAPKLSGRVVNVTSGGMYTARIDVHDLQTRSRPYDGAAVYAQTKRAQVILTEQWAERLGCIAVHAMHPGWADTLGLAASLPGFHRLMKPLLRTPEQGADTIVWLGAADEPARSTGLLWHDRRPRPTHLVPWTRETADERARLWEACETLSS
jgi:dehydrogenase/reductase SDR family member 12